MNTSWRRPLGALLIVSLAGPGCEAQRSVTPPAAKKTAPSPLQLRLEALAGSLKRFPTSDVLYDRCGLVHPLGLVEPELANLLEGVHSADAILPLLRHQDPKVRTLALALLFDREEPEYLPQIVALATDDAETFPDAMEAAIPWPPTSADEAIFESKQTVGRIAELMARSYLRSAGHHYGTAGSAGREPGFAEYWQLRHERKHCAGWWEVKLERAASGCSPTPQERVGRIKQLRERIDQLPEIERQTTLLFLGSRRDAGEGGADATMGGAVLVSVDELVGACKQLGRERLLELLHGESLTDDPDFHPRCDNVWRAKLFILRHAAVLLTKEDAPTLLRLDEEVTARRRERHAPSPTALWRIAAAQLDPDLGREPLRSAFTLVPNANSERAEIIFAIWRIYGESEAAYVLDRFYPSELPCQESLLRRAEAADDRELLRRIIADARFDALDGRAVRITLRILNRFVGESLVPENELDRDHIPIPDNWRQVVRDSLPRWSS